MTTRIVVADWAQLEDRKPTHALVANVDLVIVRHDDDVSVLYGRCLHRGALLSDGCIKGKDILCGLHGWDFQYETGISSYDNAERLKRFTGWVADNQVCVDEAEIATWERENPQPFNRDQYLGNYADTHPVEEEPHVGLIQSYARDGLSKTGRHGLATAMGVSRTELPTWDDIQFITAQLAKPPHLDEVEVGTEVVIGPNASPPSRHRASRSGPMCLRSESSRTRCGSKPAVFRSATSSPLSTSRPTSTLPWRSALTTSSWTAAVEAQELRR